MDRGTHSNYGSVDPVRVQVVPSEASPDFQLSEFLTLCDKISSNIYLIQNNASSLERAHKQVGTSMDSQPLRERIHNTQQKTNKIVNSTTQLLRQATHLSKLGKKQHKFQVDKIHNDFRGTVERYSTLQKKIAEKIKSVLLRPGKTEQLLPATDWSSGEDDEERQKLLREEEERRRQRQLQLENDELEYGLFVEREDRIRQIEADVLNVNEIFRDLAAMVEEQGITVNTIEANIETGAYNVETGTEQLAKAAAYQKKYRVKLCIFLIVLLIIAIVVIVIVVTTQQK